MRVLLRGSWQHPEFPQRIQDGALDASLRVEGVDVAAQESGREGVRPPCTAALLGELTMGAAAIGWWPAALAGPATGQQALAIAAARPHFLGPSKRPFRHDEFSDEIMG